MCCVELRQQPDLANGFSTKHIQLDMVSSPGTCATSSSTTYQSGDNVMLYPKNDPDLVNRVARLLGWQDILDHFISFDTDGDRRVPFPVPCTLRFALTNYCSLHDFPRAPLIAALAESSKAKGGVALDPSHQSHLIN